jgi:hypothetical protein
MEKKPKIFKDGYKIIFQYQKKPGELQKIDEYLTIRVGVSWPTPNSPFYCCFLALKDEPTLTEKKLLELLDEGKSETMENFFERLTRNANRFLCELVVADFKNNKGFEDSLLKFVREKNIKDIRRYDSSEFEDFDHGISLIRQYKKDSALAIRENTILLRQLQAMTPDDAKEKFEERFYAVAALCRVLGSFENRRWRKPSGPVRFSNFANRTRKGNTWDGSYQEFDF